MNHEMINAVISGLLFLFCIVCWRQRRKEARAEEKDRTGNPPSLELTEWDRQSIAYHEAGHAVCSFFLPEREPLVRITIDPSAEGFGMIQTQPRLHHNETRVSFVASIATLLAGRLSEELLLGVTSTSCIHDLAAARRIAADMVVRFGMGEKYGLAVPCMEDGTPIGAAAAEAVGADIRRILLEARQTASVILAGHRETVRRLAETLLEKKTLNADEIKDFFASVTEKA